MTISLTTRCAIDVREAELVAAFVSGIGAEYVTAAPVTQQMLCVDCGRSLRAHHNLKTRPVAARGGARWCGRTGRPPAGAAL